MLRTQQGSSYSLWHQRKPVLGAYISRSLVPRVKKVTTYSNCITVLGLNSTDCIAISQPTTDWMSLLGLGKASSLHTYLIELNEPGETNKQHYN